MTGRGGALLVAGSGVAAWGWHAGWPEFTALGAAAISLVVLVVLAAGPRPRLRIEIERSSLRVSRGEPATVRITVHGRARRWLRLVEGPPMTPVRTLPMPRRSANALAVPLDTSRRGMRPIGPYSVVHGDPWSILRRQVATADGGVVTVLPRVHQVRRSLLARYAVGESELSSKRSGDQHFHALRDYVLGDEPRMVHWRSSARAGRLVVKQQVSAAASGTLFVLDTDASAYASEERFGSGWDEERFEAAVEVAASLVSSSAAGADQVHLMTTSRHGAMTTAVAGATVLLEVLSVVDAVPPMDTRAEEITAAARRARSARVVLVTGTPGERILGAVRGVTRTGSSAAVVRVGALARAPIAGLRTIDVASPEDLSRD